MADMISACITAGNEERNIRRCLESVTWADEIVVVDSFSTDRTAEICREYTDRVYAHRWLGYIGQKNLVKDLAVGNWDLFIDADEEISAELRDEILQEFRSGNGTEYAGYEFPRMVYYLGRWIRHGDWYPDVKLRVFRKELGQCGGKEPHDRISVQGRIKRLKSPMYHYTYGSISDQLATLNKFSTIMARTYRDEQRRFRLHYLLVHPLCRFLRGYILKRGFMDGIPGLFIAATAGYGCLAKYAKLWEISRRVDREEGPPDGAETNDVTDSTPAAAEATPQSPSLPDDDRPSRTPPATAPSQD